MNLSGAVLNQISVTENTDLRRFDLSKTSLYGARLAYVDLSGAWLVESNLSSAYLYGAKLTRSLLNFSSVEDAEFTDAIFDDAVITGIDLTFLEDDDEFGPSQEQLDVSRWHKYHEPVMPRNRKLGPDGRMD